MPDGRIRSTRRLLVAGLTLIVAGTLVASAFIALRLRQEALGAANATVAMHSRAFEDHLTLALQAVDITVKGIALGPAARTDAAGNNALFDILRNAPHLRSVSLLDDTGSIVASTNPANVGLQVDARKYFPAAAGTDQLRLGAPVASRDFADAAAGDAAGNLRANGFVPVLRTLTARHGTARVLVALNADYFLNQFSQKLEAIGGRVRLVRYDGLPLLSNTAPDEPDDAWPAMAGLLESREFDIFDHVSAAGRHYVTAYHASRLYPFAVVVQIERDSVLAAWASETRILSAVVLPLLLATVLLAVFVYRRQLQSIAGEMASERERRIAASVFEASSDSILLTDPQANIIAVNAAFSRLNGYTPDEAIGRNPRFLSSGNQSADYYAQLWRAVETDGIWQGEIVNRRKDGSNYDALLTVTAVRGEDGVLLHYVGTATDITQRKQHEMELIAARDRAEAGARAKAAFLATMSHEIRTPMNGILGMIQLSLMTKPSDKVRGYLDIAKSSADSLLTILNDVLDFSKAEAGHITIEKRPYNPASLVAEVADLFAARAAEKGIALSHAADAHLPDRVTGDETRVRQVLTNLLSNAIKFTAAGHATISVALSEDRRMILYSVVDTGIGIETEMHSQVFAPFSQADDSITRKYGGTGLGLAICRQLADLMGGTITLESTPGAGSRFTLLLPLDSGATRAQAQPRSAVRPAGPGQRALSILVAEDMPVNQALMRALLSNEGHQVKIAGNGVEAVAMAKAGRFDLILMDMHMPEMDGLEATRRLREDEAAASLAPVPVIALTASVFPLDRAACAAAGMDDFLAKPLEVDALRDCIYRHSMRAAAVS